MLVGDDISQFQGQIDWDTYKDNSNFAIIRATFGNGYFDQWFAHNRDEARRVGLPIAFYHYSYPEYNSPEDEAAWFCKAVYDLKQGEVLCLDFEEAYAGDKVDWCKRFLDYVSNHFNGIKPLLYLNNALRIGNNWGSVKSAGYGLWLADYTYDPQKSQFPADPWDFVAIQQWTNQESVKGIGPVVDGDAFFGDATAFKKYGYQIPAPSPAVAPVQPAQPIQPIVNTSTNTPTTGQGSTQASDNVPTVSSVSTPAVVPSAVISSPIATSSGIIAPRSPIVPVAPPVLTQNDKITRLMATQNSWLIKLIGIIKILLNF